MPTNSQTRQTFALIAVIGIIALALGITVVYSISTGKTTTSTATQTVTSFGIRKGLSTVTKLIIISYVAHLIAYTCGTSSFVAGTINVDNSTTTEFIFRQQSTSHHNTDS